MNVPLFYFNQRQRRPPLSDLFAEVFWQKAVITRLVSVRCSIVNVCGSPTMVGLRFPEPIVIHEDKFYQSKHFSEFYETLTMPRA